MTTNSTKRQLSKGIDEGITNTLQKVSHAPAMFIKCPVNIATINWKQFRLYVRYLDLKAQSPNLGTFEIEHNHRAYQRVIKRLIEKKWASRKDGVVHLRSYQAVWRLMGINRVNVKSIWKFKYWKFQIQSFSDDRKLYLKEIEIRIRENIAKRKLAQLRYALKDEGVNDQATFSAKSTSSLFGYRSPSTGSKLRKRFFEVLPQSDEESKPKFNVLRGRFEEPTKKIAI